MKRISFSGSGAATISKRPSRQAQGRIRRGDLVPRATRVRNALQGVAGFGANISRNTGLINQANEAISDLQLIQEATGGLEAQLAQLQAEYNDAVNYESVLQGLFGAIDSLLRNSFIQQNASAALLNAANSVSDQVEQEIRVRVANYKSAKASEIAAVQQALADLASGDYS